MMTSRWGVLGFLCVAGFLNYADRSIFSAVLVPLRADLQLSNTHLGFLSSLFLWSYALACPIAGVLADRYSRRTIVLGSLGAWSVLTALTGAINGLIGLVLLRAAFGVAQSFYLPAALALIGDQHEPKTQGRAFSIHSIALNLGIIAGATSAGYLAEHFGWRAGFLALGTLGVVVVLFGRRSFARESTSAATVAERPTVREVVKFLLQVPTFHVILAKIMLSGFTIWIFLSWLPLYFREVLHLSLGGAGFAGTFIIQVAFILGLASGGWISDRVAAGNPCRRLLMLAWCYLGAAPFLLIFLANPGFAAVAVAVGLFSFLRGMGDASEKPALCAVVPARYRASAVGAMNTLANANGGIGVFLIGLLKDQVSMNAMFACLSVVLVLAGAVSWFGAVRFMARDVERERAFSRPAQNRPTPDRIP